MRGSVVTVLEETDNNATVYGLDVCGENSFFAPSHTVQYFSSLSVCLGITLRVAGVIFSTTSRR